MPYYCLTTAPLMEFRAESAVIQRGFTAILPFQQVETIRRYSPRLGDMRPPTFRKTPMLRRYLIVQAATPDEIGGLIYDMSRDPSRLITGVLRRNGGYGPPSALPSGCVEYLNDLSGTEVRTSSVIAPLIAGQTARIIPGHPYSGQQAEILEWRGKNARMLLKILGGMVHVDVPAKLLEAVA